MTRRFRHVCLAAAVLVSAGAAPADAGTTRGSSDTTGPQAASVSAALASTRRAWTHACRDSASVALAAAAEGFREAALASLRFPGTPARQALALLVETDGLVATELARRGQLQHTSAGGDAVQALSDSLDHHVPLHPIQRIVDFQDARYRIEVDPYPALDVRDAFTVALWLRLEGEVSVDETKIWSHAGVSEGKATLMLRPGRTLDVLVVLETGSTLRARTAAPLPIGAWVHVAVVFDRRRDLQVFVDGKEVALQHRGKSQRAAAGVRPAPRQVLYLGGLDRILPGSLDDVRMYDRPLSPDEVGALVRRVDVRRGIIGHWPLDDTAGASAANSVHTGTLARIGSGVVCGVEGVPGLGRGRAMRFSRARQEWIDRMQHLESALVVAERRLLQAAPPPEPAPSPELVLDRLRESRAVLVVYAADRERDRILVCVVAPNGESPWHFAVTQGLRAVEAKMSTFVDLVRDKDKSSSDSAARVRVLGRELAAILWDPVAPFVPSDVEVWLRLDPCLHALPFAALVGREGDDLVERHAFARVGPLRGMRTGSPPQAGEHATIVAFGNPAYGGFPGITAPLLWRDVRASTGVQRGPGSAACFVPGRALFGTHVELQRLRALGEKYGHGVRVQEWDDAYEKQLREAATTCTVLHFATHSYRLEAGCLPLAPWNPLTCVGLQMAGVARARSEENRADDDGLLSAHEISRLPLGDAALVVFSGCSTALGPEHAGEGPFGLPLAAWIAGAGASLATLWDVDDDTMPETMHAFYAAWLTGQSPARALQQASRQAKEATQSARRHTHAAHWAALVVEGL